MFKKKTQIFQNVSEAINLESKGYCEVAFKKYLDSIQMLSNLLVEQFNSGNCRLIFENNKKETKQILSVVSDCAERASVILTANVPAPQGSGTTLADRRKPAIGHIPASNEVSSSVSTISSRNPEQYSSVFPRNSTFDKIAVENASLCRKYQMRIEKARDNYSRTNLELELQRRLAENLAIAKQKYTQMQKEYQDERKKIFEITMKNLSKAEPCLNEYEQERRILYVQSLEYEAKNTRHLHHNFSESTISQVADKLLTYILKTKNHPLNQWLKVKQEEMENKLRVVTKQYSCFREWLPAFNHQRLEDNSAMLLQYEMDGNIIFYKSDCFIHDELDKISQEIQENVETLLQIFCHVYKNELSSDPEMLCYRSVESCMLSPLWNVFITVCRYTHINMERKIAHTMNCYKDDDFDDFGIPPNVIKNKTFIEHIVRQLQVITTFSSVTFKVKYIVDIVREICEPPEESGSCKSMKLGANDLIPILSYVLTLAKIPQLFSECKAIELIMDPKYMLGEEGYALTSVQTALNYLAMKTVTEPNDESIVETKNEE